MSEIIEHDIPMWGIGGDEELDQKASIIADTRKKIASTEEALSELENQLNVISKRSSMYIKNVMDIDDYDTLKHMLFINDKFQASIYTIELFNKVKSFKDLPEPNESFQLTEKQTNRILETMSEYDGLIDDYEEFNESYEDLVDYHNEIWEDVIHSLTNFSGLQVYDTDTTEEIEEFDLDKHVLLVVRDENSEWVFRYIRKEHEESFNQLVEDELM